MNVLYSGTMAPNGVNGVYDDEDIDYSDIEAKCVCLILMKTLRFKTLPRRYQVQYDEGLDNILVVDGVPVTDESKREKLLARIAKEFGKKGAPVKPDDMFIPWDEKTGKSKGCAI